MMRVRTTIAAATGAAALGVGLGIAGFASAAPSPSPTPSASSSASTASPDAPGDHRGGPGGRHGDRGGELATALAEKLDVDQAEVLRALHEYRDANRPTTRPDPGTAPAEPDDAALAKALAEALDKPEADVTQALAEIRSERDAARAQAVEDRLAEAVTAGTLTQAEADAVQKAADAGIVHVGR